MSTRPPKFEDDGFGSKGRIGLVYMASSVVMEDEMNAMAAPGVTVHASRLRFPKVTVEGIDDMMRSPELEQAVALVGQAPIDVVCFGGTSASFLHGTAWDAALIEKIANWTDGIAATTASTASVAALDQVASGGPISLVTPYVDEIIERAESFFVDNGHAVVASAGMGITSDWDLAEVPLQRVYDMAMAVDRPETEAIFISCTNLRSIGAIVSLEEALGKPVVSAVQASFWHSLQVAGIDHGWTGRFGSLFNT